MKKIGKIKNMHPSFEWKIPDFLSLSAEVGALFFSPDFKYEGAYWFLEMYPNGRSREWCGNISLNLVRRKSKCPKHIVTCQLSLKDTGDKVIMHRELIRREFVDIEHGRGWPDFLARAKVLKELDKAPNCRLIISCTFSEGRAADVAQEITLLEVDQVFQNNIAGLLLSNEDEYVILKVEGREFRALKAILEAQSPVFRSMLQYDILDRNIRIIDIPDCNPDIFQEFLVYLYSGRVEKMDTRRIDGLYKMAEKFLIPDLKKQCTDQDLHNFRILLRSKEEDYMTLKMEGREFRVHKTILEAQCPVFTYMFRTGIVDIPGCDSDIFQDFLFYVYSGRVGNTDTRRIDGLYKMADKFRLDDLKKKCEKFIIKPIMKKRPNTVRDVVVSSLSAPFH